MSQALHGRPSSGGRSPKLRDRDLLDRDLHDRSQPPRRGPMSNPLRPLDRLHAVVDGHDAQVLVDNPARRNAFDLAMWQALPPLFAALEAHPDVRVIVVRGAGGLPFASGADISEFETLRATAAGGRAYEAANEAAFRAVAACRKPVIAMLRGFCLGGGLGLSYRATCASPRRAASSAYRPDGSASAPPGRDGLCRGRCRSDGGEGPLLHRPADRHRRSPRAGPARPRRRRRRPRARDP